MLAIATPSGHSVSVLGAAVPLDVARFLTWLAVLYYSAAFLLEWRVARITNSKAISSESSTGVLKRFEELAETFKRFYERITEASGEYVNALEKLKGNIDQFGLLLPKSMDRLRDIEHPSESPQAYDYFLKAKEQIDTQFGYFKTTLETDRSIASSKAQENLDAYAAIGGALNELAADFRTLAGRFNTEQRIIFYVLDLGAVGLMFIVATAIAAMATMHIISACIT